jgi:hypothetical protein
MIMILRKKVSETHPVTLGRTEATTTLTEKNGDVAYVSDREGNY